jgi:hypothetical protein
MRVDVCTTEDEDTKAALLAALAAVGAVYDEDDPRDSSDVALGVGLHRFRTARGEALTVFADAWGVDLDGPDELVNRVLAILAGAG